MIIDSHSHWLPEEIITNAHFYHKGWGDIESQLKIMTDSGIDKAVLSYPTSDAHLKLAGVKETARIFNDNVAKIIKRFPEKFIGAAILPIGKSSDMLEELVRARDSGLRAISLASSYNGVYLDDPMFLPVYDKAQKEGILIFVHSQIVNPIGTERVQDPLLTPVVEYIFDMTISIGKLLMSDVLSGYSGTKFIFANFGGAIAFLQHRFDATYQMLRGINFVKDLKGKPTDYLKNIYVDTGGDTTATNFQLALELFGPQRVLWGSDWPAKKDISGSIAAVRSLSLSKEEKESILGNNLGNLLR